MERMIQFLNALAGVVGKDVVVNGTRMWLMLKETEEFLATNPNLVFSMAPAASVPAPTAVPTALPTAVPYGAALCATPCGQLDPPSPRPEPSDSWSTRPISSLDLLASAAFEAPFEPESELERLATAVAEFALSD